MRFSFLFYEPIATLDELGARMGLLAELGFQGIELSACHPAPYSAPAARGLAERHGLPIVSLLSGWSYSHEGLCLSSPDAGVRSRAVERLGDYAGWAAEVGALVVVGLMQGLRRDEPDPEVANARIAAGLKQAAARAQAVGTRLVLEPVNHFQVGFNHTAEEAAALVERVASSAFGYMLDTIHMNIEERSIFETIGRHGSVIGHFHLCETNGGRFGTGGLDFRSVLQALEAAGYPGFVSVKVYRTPAWQHAARSAAAFLRELGFMRA